MSERILRLTGQLLTNSARAGCVDQAMLDDAQDWGVDGIVPIEGELHADIATTRRAQAMALRAEAARDRIVHAAIGAVETCERHGVMVTPFKGLSTQRFYPATMNRWYADADLFIADPNAGDLLGALLEIGMARTGAVSIVELASANQLFGCTYFEGSVGLDIHFNPTSQFFQPRSGAPDYLSTEVLTSIPGTQAPRAEFDLMVAAVNSVRDAGRSLKAAVDVVLIMQNAPADMDWDRFDEIVHHYDMHQVVRPAIATIERELDVDLQDRLDRRSEPLKGYGLLRTPTFWTRKRSNLLNLYFGPNRLKAAQAAARWIVPSTTRMHAEGDNAIDASHLTRRDLWRERWERVRNEQI